MKYLIKLKINDRKIEDIIEIKEEETKENKIEELIENNLKFESDNMFYYDKEEFIKEKVKFIKEIKNPPKKLFKIEVNEYQGWDTYDSAIICEYTKKKAKEIAVNKLGNYFEESKIEEIGIANISIEKGVVNSSFNAG